MKVLKGISVPDHVRPNMGVPGLRPPFNPVTLEMIGNALGMQNVRPRPVSSSQDVHMPGHGMGIEPQASRHTENYMSGDGGAKSKVPMMSHSAGAHRFPSSRPRFQFSAPNLAEQIGGSSRQSDRNESPRRPNVSLRSCVSNESTPDANAREGGAIDTLAKNVSASISETVSSVMKEAMHDLGDSVGNMMNNVCRCLDNVTTVIQQTSVLNAAERYQASNPPPQSLPVSSNHNQTSRASYSQGNVAQYDEDSVDDAQTDVEESENVGSSHSSTLRQRSQDHGRKLPPFTGKETWEVWFNRFNDVADRYGWSQDRKLDEMLPRLQGTAGEFVFGQLSHEVRSSYRRLLKELGARFRKVESSKSYVVQFSRRSQRPGESVEQFSAELKRLYDKAHPNRDAQTRHEDILRRFHDGLYDQEASFQVEFIKNPSTVDEAVDEVVSYIESRKSSGSDAKYAKKSVRRIPDEICENDLAHPDEGCDDERIARVQNSHKSGSVSNKVNSVQLKAPANAPTSEVSEKLSEMSSMMKSLQEEIVKLKESNKRSFKPTYSKPSNENNGAMATNTRPRRSQLTCYKCGENDHIVRDCPNPSLIDQMKQQLDALKSKSVVPTTQSNAQTREKSVDAVGQVQNGPN